MSVINGLYYGEDTLKSYGMAIIDVYASWWTGDSAPYTCTVPIPSNYTNHSLYLYSLVPEGDDVTEAERVCFSCITSMKRNNDNTLTFTADTKKPLLDLQIALRTSMSTGVDSIINSLGDADISGIGDGTLTGAIRQLSRTVIDNIINVPKTAWTKINDTSYVADIESIGLLETVSPIYGLYSKSTKPSDEVKMAYSCITDVIVTDNNVKLYADAAITVDMDIVLKGCQKVDTNGASSFIINIADLILHKTDWVLDTTNNMYYSTVTNEFVTKKDQVLLKFKVSSLEEVKTCEILSDVEIYDGSFRVYSKTCPTKDVTCDYTLISSGSSSSPYIRIVGDLEDLTTTDKSSLISAMNEINELAKAGGDGSGSGSGNYVTKSTIGDLSDLTTTDKSSIVLAMNEINRIAKAGGGSGSGVSSEIVGDISTLLTTNKTSIVSAINELSNRVNSLESGTPKLSAVNVTYNSDGSIVESYSDGGTIVNTFNEDGSVVQTATYPDGKVLIKTTTIDGDGNVTEVVTSSDSDEPLLMSVNGESVVDNTSGATSGNNVDSSTIGDLSTLETTSKTSIVSAINELTNRIIALEEGTPILTSVQASNDEDGSLIQTYSDGGSIKTSFNEDGSIVQVASYPDSTTKTKTIVVNEDGNVTETIS